MDPIWKENSSRIVSDEEAAEFLNNFIRQGNKFHQTDRKGKDLGKHVRDLHQAVDAKAKEERTKNRS